MTAIYPTLRYRDAPAAIAFLCDAFGFERHAVYDDGAGGVVHAELRLGDDYVMLGSARDQDRLGMNEGIGQTTVYVAVDDVDARYERARVAGAEIITGITEQSYGSREFAARDPEGNRWSFGTYRPS